MSFLFASIKIKWSLRAYNYRGNVCSSQFWNNECIFHDKNTILVYMESAYIHPTGMNTTFVIMCVKNNPIYAVFINK